MNALKNMDMFGVRLLDVPRVLDVSPRVRRIGYLPWEYPNTRSHYRASIDCGLVLSSEMKTRELLVDGEKYIGSIPQFFIALPGYANKYSLVGRIQALYFTYETVCLPWFESKIANLRPMNMWDVTLSDELIRSLNDMFALIENFRVPGNVDKLDMHCQTLLLNHCLTRVADMKSGEKTIHEIESFLSLNFRNKIDFDRLARRHGVSKRTFFRNWSKTHAVTPVQHLTCLRVNEACQLLVDSNMSVAEVAAKVGFDDPYYFAKVFRKATGTTASRYRKGEII